MWHRLEKLAAIITLTADIVSLSLTAQLQPHLWTHIPPAITTVNAKLIPSLQSVGQTGSHTYLPALLAAAAR